MHLRILISVFLCFITKFGVIESIQQFGNVYSIYKNSKCGHDVRKRLNSSIALECAAQCLREGCSSVNFKSPECELLINDQSNETILVEEDGWQCIRE